MQLGPAEAKWVCRLLCSARLPDLRGQNWLALVSLAVPSGCSKLCEKARELLLKVLDWHQPQASGLR